MTCHALISEIDTDKREADRFRTAIASLSNREVAVVKAQDSVNAAIGQVQTAVDAAKTGK